MLIAISALATEKTDVATFDFESCALEYAKNQGQQHMTTITKPLRMVDSRSSWIARFLRIAGAE
jgi:hypothetical protein